MNPKVQVRKLDFQQKNELAMILDRADSWKTLMTIIPKSLENDNFVCDISRINKAKYDTHHFKLLEKISADTKQSCTQILLRDWETSGKVLPTLGHLLYLLTKAKLYGAADYVAVELLKQKPPVRPKLGLNLNNPAVQPKPGNIDKVEKILDEINYPSRAIENIMKNNTQQHKIVTKPVTPPEIVISESPDEKSDADMFIPLVIQNKTKSSVNAKSDEDNNNVDQKIDSQSVPQISALMNKTECDMIQFSKQTVSPAIATDSQNVPCLSGLMEKSESDLIRFSSVNNNNDLLPEVTKVNSQNLPQLSALLEMNDSQILPQLSFLSQEVSDSFDDEQKSSSSSSNMTSPQDTSVSTTFDIESETTSDNIPHLSNLLSQDVSNIEPIIPHMSVLNSDISYLNDSTDSYSVLPNLSLNTHVPHFSYDELAMATKNFNDVPYFKDENGRFLGSGISGSVYLAEGLLNKRVAVKKVYLNGGNTAGDNKMIVKQFQNEVEVLSKYHHANLLSLIGYSCDGETYCLLSDFIPGGTLAGRLKVSKNKLKWTERLDIALETACAVSYLHTAYSKPLIHRDIKSSNILLDTNNKPKLCDFGLSKLLVDNNPNLNTSIIGTAAYMAPEAFSRDISVKVDTFSFGVVLFELLTSLPAVDKRRECPDLLSHITETCENKMDLLVDTEAGTWSSNNINAAEEIFRLAQKCVEDEANARPTMVAVTEELKNLLEKCNIGFR